MRSTRFVALARCSVDAKSEALLNEQNNFIVSDSTMHQVDNDFDCVDMYKQSALQHPLLKNHKIQLYPTFAKNVVRSRKNGECPAGKVPTYKRTREHQNVTDSKFQFVFDLPDGYHTVSLNTTKNCVYGGSAVISIYSLSLSLGQSSSSLICVESGPQSELNEIYAGLTVHPALYGDSRPRLTTEWRVLGSNNIGCIDKQCPGFVQVAQIKPYIGEVQSPSTPIGSGDKKSVLRIIIQRDKSTGNWWLIVNDVVQVGYWPKELFTHLREGASLLRFGGRVWAGPTMPNPPMGSGRLPTEGYENAALFGKLMAIDFESSRIDVNPEDMIPYNNAKSNCYDLKYYEYSGTKYRQAFLFGGPGGKNCDK